jgi:acetylornithine deacetylase/succinyl-diaminopimelate desuccinylase-like protein
MSHSAPYANRAQLAAIASQPSIQGLLADWPRLRDDLIDEALAIQAIPAPTFGEALRAEHIRARLAAVGAADVALDEIGNVWARTPGVRSDRPAVMISAHLDTVFDAAADLSARRDAASGTVTAPGLGDNALGLAALIALAREMHRREIVPTTDIWWVATVGEEGLGDLRGMRRAIEEIGDRLGLVLVLEGLGLGRIYHAGLAVRRLRVEITGPGGHSWLHSDRPSAIHALIRIGAALLDEVKLPQSPVTTLNIGLVEGGTSINSRAAHASLSIDLRSEDARTLKKTERALMTAIQRTPLAPNIQVKTSVIGDRPSATLPPQHPLVAAAQSVLEFLECGPCTLDIGSTDANIPLARGISAVCIGLTTGGDAHTFDEYIEIAPLATGMKQLTLLALLVAEHSADWKHWG